MTEVISRYEQGLLDRCPADRVVEVGRDLPEIVPNRLQHLRRTAVASGCLILASLGLVAANARSSSERRPAYTPAPPAIQADFPVPVRCYKTDSDFYLAEGIDPNKLIFETPGLLAGFYRYPYETPIAENPIVGFSPGECTALEKIKRAVPMYPEDAAAAEYIKIHELQHATTDIDRIVDPVYGGDFEGQADCQTAKTYSEYLYRDGFRGHRVFNLLTFLAQRNTGYDPQKTRHCWPVWLTKDPDPALMVESVAIIVKPDPEFK
ncbi:hypothetical protein HYW35_01905 [Candidatus Saccharibacteria bacterium]|nr:hypothetical protein [Candidatus Saccharibacteria bacterium]